jgi:uncharacterized membrane protein YkvA (DUF1232 family)
MSIPQRSGQRTTGAPPHAVRREPGSFLDWRQQSERFQREARVCYFVFKHPRVRWYARAVAACTAAYLFSPIQLIPSFLPAIGFLDDFVVIVLGVKLLQRIIPSEVLSECRELAEAAQIVKRDKIKLAMLTLLWLVAAVTGSALMVKYFLLDAGTPP